MTQIEVTLDQNWLAKDKHPMPKPIKKFEQSKEEYEQLLQEWLDIDKNLKRYPIKELVCESGIRIESKWIRFYYGENRLAELNDDGTVNILPEKLLKMSKK